MLSNISIEKRNEINNFFLKEFNMDIRKYSEQELDSFLEIMNDVLDKIEKREEEELENLKKKLENEKMILDPSITDAN